MCSSNNNNNNKTLPFFWGYYLNYAGFQPIRVDGFNKVFKVFKFSQRRTKYWNFTPVFLVVAFRWLDVQNTFHEWRGSAEQEQATQRVQLEAGVRKGKVGGMHWPWPRTPVHRFVFFAELPRPGPAFRERSTVFYSTVLYPGVLYSWKKRNRGEASDQPYLFTAVTYTGCKKGFEAFFGVL